MQAQQTDEARAALMQAVKEVHVTYVKQQITLLNALKDALGPEVARVVEQANSQEICQTYQELARQSGKSSIEDLVAVLWEPLRSRGYEFTAEQTEQGLQMHCTACPFATLYRQLGGAEWGFHLYCAADEQLAQAFNPSIGFKRTKTLMEGDEYCDHLYFYQD
jgi:predicted ArsR family transcriptional regulator